MVARLTEEQVKHFKEAMEIFKSHGDNSRLIEAFKILDANGNSTIERT